MDDWYSINSDKITIMDDYQNEVIPVILSPKKPVNLYVKFLELNEKIADILNEVRENNDHMEKRLVSIEKQILNENLLLKNKLIEKELELARIKNLLLRHKISFPFISSNTKYLLPEKEKKGPLFNIFNSMEKMLKSI